MSSPGAPRRSTWTAAWPLQAALLATAVAVGFALMPLLIYLAGSMALGRYENASAGRIYHAVYAGLAGGSPASWVVVLGPLGLYLLFGALRLWWRAGSSPR